jgi:ankyrin repeat protein
MLLIMHVLVAAICVLFSVVQDNGSKSHLLSVDHETAQAHEIKPHRYNIPNQGFRPGSRELHLALIVSPAGSVVSAKAQDLDPGVLSYWPEIETEVMQWKFKPFQKDGAPVTAEVQEYVNIVPPERIPKLHVPPPELRPDSSIRISLQRSGCFGSCPSYTVEISADGIAFEGKGSVVASGKPVATSDPGAARKLAKRFVDADFYSLDSQYIASITDNPVYRLTLTIDGHAKQVVDYVGYMAGMPAIVTDLEDEVDALANTSRWTNGADGLVPLLQAEKFNFQSSAAQTMLKDAASRGQTATVREFLAAGLPLKPFRPLLMKDGISQTFAERAGYLTAASRYPDVLQLLLDAHASAYDQSEKDIALNAAATLGHLDSVRALIAYGANPNVDLEGMTIAAGVGSGMWLEPGHGTILISAAHSSNPDVVREILRYHPPLEARGAHGITAISAATSAFFQGPPGSSVDCLRLLAAAGADVNVADDDGNTPLHSANHTDVAEELLNLGANVNARNHDGETPIFTVYDDNVIPVFIKHGADLSLRNNKGQTVLEAAANKSPARQETLRQAIEHRNQPH